MLTNELQLLRIGELEIKSQISIKTLRYYEELGLIHSAQRTQGGFRLFSPEILPRLEFIKRAQSLGFSLQEIRHILDLRDRGEIPCSEVMMTLQTKIDHLDRQIEHLMLLKSELTALMSHAKPLTDPTSESICPIIQPQ